MSAVIPVHNGERYVAEAISSVLAQTRAPLECLVIDDGSTDATADVVRRFGSDVIYVRRDRGGVSAARNHGVEVACGDLIGFLDHDDAWLPNKLERQVATLTAEAATMVLCAVEIIDSGGRLLGTRRVHAREDLVTGMVLFDGSETVSCSSTGLVDREAFVRSGGFDPALSTSADWDLLLRILLTGHVAYVDEPLVRYRVHDVNMSRNVGAMEHDMRYALAKAFADSRLPESVRVREREAYGRLYWMIAGSYRDRGERVAALRALAMSMRQRPQTAFDVLRLLGRRPALRRSQRPGTRG